MTWQWRQVGLTRISSGWYHINTPVSGEAWPSKRSQMPLRQSQHMIRVQQCSVDVTEMEHHQLAWGRGTSVVSTDWKFRDTFKGSWGSTSYVPVGLPDPECIKRTLLAEMDRSTKGGFPVGLQSSFKAEHSQETSRAKAACVNGTKELAGKAGVFWNAAACKNVETSQWCWKCLPGSLLIMCERR